MPENTLNRYRNTTNLQQTFYIVDSGDTVTVYPDGDGDRPGGTVLAAPDSVIARASFMELVDENVEVPADGRHESVIVEGSPKEYDRKRAAELRVQAAQMAAQTQNPETQQSAGSTEEKKTNPRLTK